MGISEKFNLLVYFAVFCTGLSFSASSHCHLVPFWVWSEMHSVRIQTWRQAPDSKLNVIPYYFECNTSFAITNWKLRLADFKRFTMLQKKIFFAKRVKRRRHYTVVLTMISIPRIILLISLHLFLNLISYVNIF